MSKLGFKKLDEMPVFRKAIAKYKLKFIIFDPVNQLIIEWKK